MIATLAALQSCNGIMDGIYDNPPAAPAATVDGQLYIDASDWAEWHYIDFPALARAVNDDPEFNTSSLWSTYPVAMPGEGSADGKSGIYTYWYDVFGQGISVYEFRDHTPGPAQQAAENWTIAVHRNNVRTNGCAAAVTDYRNIDDLPTDAEYLESLHYEQDAWNETDVWVIQDHMLEGLIGNQGIEVNPVLSSWLEVKIPPMPPAFVLNDWVFVLRLPDGTYGALQLADYQSPRGVKCCLTINYRYPL